MNPPAILRCLDRSANVAEINETFMLHNAIWLEANPADAGMLCVGCVEARLNRRLTPGDFTEAPLNYPEKLAGLERIIVQSDRLRDRCRKHP